MESGNLLKKLRTSIFLMRLNYEMRMNFINKNF